MRLSIWFGESKLLGMLFELNPSKLEALFTIDKIRDAISSFKGDKSSSLDGFLMYFFQHFWSLICTDLVASFAQMHKFNIDFALINYGTLTLIYKTEAISSLLDFHLISVHGCLKFTKSLANRLQPFLDKLINSVQMVYNKNRDNFQCANKIIHR